MKINDKQNIKSVSYGVINYNTLLRTSLFLALPQLVYSTGIEVLNPLDSVEAQEQLETALGDITKFATSTCVQNSYGIYLLAAYLILMGCGLYLVRSITTHIVDKKLVANFIICAVLFFLSTVGVIIGWGFF